MKKNTINDSKQSTEKIRLALVLSVGISLAGLTGCGQSSGAFQPSVSDSVQEQAPPAKEAPATPAAPSADQGGQLFAATCSGCHGKQGQGVPHLGKDLQTSKFVAGLNDSQLVDFITQGRPVTDSANTTHVPMPPKGGNPALSSQDISDLVAYIRQLQQEHSASK